MSEEKSSIELLQEFANKTNRTISFTEEAPTGYLNRRYGQHKRTVDIYDKNDLVFALSKDPLNVLKTGLFAGIFFSCNLDKQATFTAKKRDFLDRFSLSGKRNSGNIFIDRKMTSETSDPLILSQVFLSQTVQNEVLELFKIDQRLVFGLNSISLDFVKSIDFHSVIGIYVLQDWLFDFDKVEKIFEKMTVIKKELDLRFSA
ncbi:MAG: hypothetical protein JXR53_06240 [Bacteroidales bacterium]|nr:hypothetical protein [Bacteroidales bacterium]